MKPRIVTEPPSPLPWILVGLFVAATIAAVLSGIVDLLNERESQRFRTACSREGGIAFIGKHGRACLWAGAVIPLDIPPGAMLSPPRPGEPTDQEPRP